MTMEKKFYNLKWFFVLLIFPITLFAQKDVTQFLGIPVEGSKSEIIQKLKDKGFTSNLYKKDILEGEFNGVEVNLHIVTNNNKVYRIMVAGVNKLSETEVRIRFNNLLKQFNSNKKYFPIPDTTLAKYMIQDDEDISYGLTIKNKRYEAVFYQKTLEYDSLETEMTNLYKKEKLNYEDKERLSLIMKKMVDRSNFNKSVWFMISELNGKYSINIYYDNEYNKANGDNL